MKALLAGALLVLGLSPSALANGKAYAAHVPPGIPYQRALILHRDGVQTLVLRFPAPAPIYPLALTGTGGHPSEVVLFLMADAKYDASDRIGLRFLDRVEPGLLDPLRQTEPAHFLEDADLRLTYLHRFQDRLEAAQMDADVIFAPEPRLRPFRVGDVR